MKTSRSLIHFFAAALVAASSVGTASCQEYSANDYEYTVTTVVGGLENPWSLAFLPGGDMLVTERPGRLRIIRNGKLVSAPVAGVPEVFARGQGGLLDVVLDPDFANNRLVYLSYSKPMGDNSTTAIARGRFENDRLTGVQDIFVADTRGNGHYGSRIAFSRDGYLFFSVGDRQAPPTGDLEAHPAQDLSNHHGTINRIYPDGRIPQDNPFVGRDDAEPSIWSFGHRNPQGLAVHPVTGDVWADEHGPQGGDELNRIKKGANYGWPVIGYGVNYRTATPIHESSSRPGMEQPAHYWVPSIATAGLLIYTGDKFPAWQGNVFVGGMAGTQLARLTLDGNEVVSEETLLERIGRVRDVRQGPDGYIYVVIDSDKGALSVGRIEPR